MKELYGKPKRHPDDRGAVWSKQFIADELARLKAQEAATIAARINFELECDL